MSEPVVAAADGTVNFVKEDTAGPTGKIEDNNKVIISHADGNVSEYLHIKQNGAVVQKGQKVMRGDLIAYSGNTGNSRAPHLHFQLRKGSLTGVSAPCKFADVPGDGIPKKNDSVTSGNFPERYRKECDYIENNVMLYSLCRDLECLEFVTSELKSLAKVKMDMPLAVLKNTLKKRDDCLAAYRKTAETRLKEMNSAIEAENIKLAVRLAVFGEKDFDETEMAKEFKTALAKLKKEKGYREAIDALKSEQQYRTKLVKAIKDELKVQKKKKGAKAAYKRVIKQYEQAIELAPGEKVREKLQKHIQELKKKL